MKLISEQDISVQAFMFDMDGTMIDSMKHHAQSREVFAQHHGLDIGIDELMARATRRAARAGPYSN